MVKLRSKFTLSSLLAVLTCPCHVPIYAILLSGTALGGLFTHYFWPLFIIFAITFLFSARIAIKTYKTQTL